MCYCIEINQRFINGTRSCYDHYNSNDRAESVQLDQQGNIFLAGEIHNYSLANVDSLAFNAYQNKFGGGSFDAFLMKYNSAGIPQFFTFFGGSGGEFGHSCSVDNKGAVYLSGLTGSSNNIAKNGFSNTLNGSNDAFHGKFCTDINFPQATINLQNSSIICSNKTNTFRAAVINGTGSINKYIWKKNNTVVGTNDSLYTPVTLATGDSISCTIIGNFDCALKDTLKSNAHYVATLLSVRLQLRINSTKSTIE